MQRLLSPDPDASPAGSGVAPPRPAPGGLELLAAELWRRAALPAGAAARLARSGPGGLVALGREATARLAGFASSALRTLRPASPVPWNGPLGPHRRIDTWCLDLDRVRTLGRRLGATVNDVVLAVVAGAVRRTLRRQDVDPAGVRFRVLAPVSVRGADEQGTLGNRVSLWVVDLPVGERDALRRLRRVREQTARLKRNGSALGAKLLADVAEWSSSTLLSLGARAATRLPAFNMIVTNVPGPQIPLYLAGARVREAYPIAPLFDHVGLDVALMSYDGRLFVGLNADYDRGPDLAALRGDLEAACAELEAVPARGRPRRDR